MADCVLPTALRLVLPGTYVSFVEIQDPANGVSLIGEIERPVNDPRQGRRTSARVRGDYATTQAIASADTYLCTVLVEGSTWAERETRFRNLETALQSEPIFYLEEVLSGVRTRWYCDAPVRVAEAPIDQGARRLNEAELDLRIHVQPNPSVTFV